MRVINSIPLKSTFLPVDAVNYAATLKVQAARQRQTNWSTGTWGSRTRKTIRSKKVFG
jgi:hypothetical protein